jgi:porphobilinogen deaminase
VAAYAEFASTAETGRGQGLVASLDGRRQIRVAMKGRDPVKLGEDLAELALEQGAAELLK